jgi:hypothetical protein
MRTRFFFLLLILLTAVPLLADDVYLTNGRKFEGVLAETTGTQVRIQMQGGTLSLPKSQVLRVETGDSNLAEYLRRRDVLRKSPATAASDWLELARWTRSKEMNQATRESALAAAALNPRLEGLGALMRSYGYVFDEQADRWMPYEESMRRRGFVLSNGQWITREELASRVRAHEEENARMRALVEERARAARMDRLAALTELTLARELVQPTAPAYPYYGDPFYGYYGYPVVISGFWMPPGKHFPNHHSPRPHSPKHVPRPPNSSNFTHVPGSLIGGNLLPPSSGH